MYIMKELTLYALLFMFIWVLGSVWNVSNAQEVTAGTKIDIRNIELELMRNQLIKESVSEESLSNYEEVRNQELDEMKKIYAEEQRLIVEEKARIEAKVKAEAKEKIRLEDIKKREEAENLKKEEQQKKQAEQQQNTIYVNTTAYTSGCNGCTGKTASGYNVQNTIYYQDMRVIAADTGILPFGTIVEIEGIGKAVVLDRGGAIKGNKIDILFGSKKEAYSYGRKNAVKLTVVGKTSF